MFNSCKISHADVSALFNLHGMMLIQALLWELLHICFFFFLYSRKWLLACQRSMSCADVSTGKTVFEVCRVLASFTVVASSLRVSGVDVSRHTGCIRCLSPGLLLQMLPALLVAVSLDRNASDSNINRGKMPLVLLVEAAVVHCVRSDRTDIIVKGHPFLPERRALVVSVGSLEILESLAQVVHIGLFVVSETLMAQ